MTADRPATEPRTAHAIVRQALRMTGMTDAQADARISALLAEAAQGAAPRGYVDGMYHLTAPEYNAALRRAYKDGLAAPRAEGIPNQPTDEMKGMCAIEQRCPLPKGHKGPHEWGGPPGWRGAAPRAEGLDVPTIHRAFEGLADHFDMMAGQTGQRAWADAATAMRDKWRSLWLSRPSDERVR